MSEEETVSAELDPHAAAPDTNPDAEATEGAAEAAPVLPPAFSELGVRPEIVAALAEDGIERTFPIQAQTLPLALDGQDIIGQAKTGTGKTLGFGVPLIQRIQVPADGDVPGKPQGMIVVPTRELAIQVGKDLEKAGRNLGAVSYTHLDVYKRQPLGDQVQHRPGVSGGGVVTVARRG